MLRETLAVFRKFILLKIKKKSTFCVDDDSCTFAKKVNKITEAFVEIHLMVSAYECRPD